MVLSYFLFRQNVYIMKPMLVKIAISFVIHFLFSMPSFTQNQIDNALYRVSYQFSYKTDAMQKKSVKTDLMYLEVGENMTKFYSRYEQIRDSIKIDGIKKRFVSPRNCRKQ